MAANELERLNERIDTLTARRERLLNLEKERQRKKRYQVQNPDRRAAARHGEEGRRRRPENAGPRDRQRAETRGIRL